MQRPDRCCPAECRRAPTPSEAVVVVLRHLVGAGVREVRRRRVGVAEPEERHRHCRHRGAAELVSTCLCLSSLGSSPATLAHY